LCMKASGLFSRLVFAGLLLVLFSFSVASAPLNVTDSDLTEFTDGVTGGDTVTVSVDFRNTVDRPVDVMPVLTFSSEEVKVTGQEFIPNRFRSRYDISSERGYNSGCAPYRNISLNAKSLYCGQVDSSSSNSSYDGDRSLGLLEAGSGDHNFSVTFQVHPLIEPASYDLEIDLRAFPGETGEGGGVYDVSTDLRDLNLSDGSTVGVRAEENGEAFVIPVTDPYASSPEGTSFVKAYKVEVFRSGVNQPEVNASGFLNLSYPEGLDQDSSIGLYRYSVGDDEWVDVTDSVDRASRMVYAEVDHFSTYAVFSSPADDSEDEGDDGESGDGGGSGGSPGFGGGGSPPDEVPEDETGDSNESEEESGEESEDGSEDSGSEDQEDEEDLGDETGQEEGDVPETGEEDEGFWSSPGSWFTGFASQSPGSGFIGFLAVMGALLLVLQYSGRGDVKGWAKDVFRSVRP